MQIAWQCGLTYSIRVCNLQERSVSNGQRDLSPQVATVESSRSIGFQLSTEEEQDGRSHNNEGEIT
jgi:hypothetical protein